MAERSKRERCVTHDILGCVACFPHGFDSEGYDLPEHVGSDYWQNHDTIEDDYSEESNA